MPVPRIRAGAGVLPQARDRAQAVEPARLGVNSAGGLAAAGRMGQDACVTAQTQWLTAGWLSPAVGLLGSIVGTDL